MSVLYVREWGEIHKGKNNDQGKNSNITLCSKAWEFLANYAESKNKEDSFLTFKNTTTLKVQNFVGVISIPDGTQIEILPKINEIVNAKSADESRLVLANMLKVVHNLPFIKTTEANLQLKNQPLFEVLIAWFLNELSTIVKRGIRKDYNRISVQERFLKGQLQTSKQLNEPPHKQYLFHIKYDIFNLNRPENRLIYSALRQVICWSRDNKNQRQAKHFMSFFDIVPLSKNYATDFNAWSNSRELNYYQPILPWLRLILNQQSPFALKGKNAGISFLLPMEVLFERYVAKVLAKRLPTKYKLTQQSPQKHLASQKDRGVFVMKPDIIIHKDNKPIYILDTKWKLINQDKQYDNGRDDKKRGIAQADMYQLFAYGKKYGVKKVLLIYPKWQNFTRCFKFKFDDDLSLSIFPFNLQKW